MLIFKSFLSNLGNAVLYQKWLRDNPGEKSRWEGFYNAILRGESPSAPSMTSAFGKALVDVGLQALQKPPTPPPAPTGMVKMASASLRWYGDYGARALDDHAALGIDWWRENITEPDGTWVRGNQAVADGMANVMRAKGKKLLPLIMSYGNAASVEMVVRRYGPGGELHCADWFEFGNEPYWSGVAPEAYARDVVVGLKAARAANPNAKLMIAGFSAVSWIEKMWAAAPDAFRLADGIAVHPYCNRTPHAVDPKVYNATDSGKWPWEYQRFKNMDATVRNLLGKSLPIFITELGWHSGGGYGDNVPASSEAQQAQYLTDAWNIAKSFGVQGFNVYCLDDRSNQGHATTAERYYGLIRADGTKKPSYAAVASLA